MAETGETATASPPEPFLLYDGECPFCSYYVAKSQFEARIGKPLHLIDGRGAPGLVDRLRREGFDLEQGMILALDGRHYHGAAAMVALKAMSAGPGRFNALARWFASSPARVRAAYPWLRRLRRAALLAKGVPRFPD
ncbi:MAG: DCC1-like thiol-disulfide oxidoreductase family protein [Rhodospirillaceae bacterium]|nr:DCC1-like thiol-disulfide oxidoreductase family protein [Rhodospirillaceae bacterium]